MGLGGVEDLLELLVEGHEVVEDTLEDRQVSVTIVEVSVHLDPLEIIEPVGRVVHWLN